MVAFLAVALLVTSLFAPIGAAATSGSAPSGMVGVPSDNLGPTVSEWDVHTDRNAGDLELELGETVDGEAMLIATDNENSEGRTVAVDRDGLVAAVGHEPTKIHGTNDESDDWTGDVEYRDGWAFIEIPHFSTNQITFDGTVELTGDPADDGSTFSYELASNESAADASVELTGVENTDEGVYSDVAWGSVDSEITTGNLEPMNEVVSVTPTRFFEGREADEGENSITWDDTTGPLEEIDTRVYCAAANDECSASQNLYIDGEQVESLGSNSWSGSSAWDETWDLDYDLHGADVEVRLEDRGSDSDYLPDFRQSYILGGSSTEEEITMTVGGDSVNLGSLSEGETVNVSADLSPGTNSIEFDGSWIYEYDLEMTERTVTEDPTVEINGESVGYDGILSDGEQTSLDVDPNWIREGTNRVNLSVSEGAGGPTAQVGFEYTHSAMTDQTVTYQGETWSEHYDVSRTWVDDRDDATLTIPFASDRVVDIRNVEVRHNGGAWTEPDDYDLDGTTLEVGLGDVADGDETAVRANGSKVAVSGGEIDVLEPTVEGDSLDTTFEIVDHSDEFAIDVGGTAEGEFLHYFSHASWSAPETSVVFDADGGQELRAPGASAGSSARVSTAALEVTPDAGTVAVSSFVDGDEPRFDVEPDGANEVDYTWHEATSGESYVLFSETYDTARDIATANSPVSFTGSGYAETLSILLDDDDGGDDGPATTAGSSSGGGGGTALPTAGGVSPLLVLIVGTGLVGGLAFAAHRTELPMWVVGVAAVIVTLLAIESISPGTISGAISESWGEVGGSILLIAATVGAYLAYRWWNTRQAAATTPDTAVTFDLGNDDGNQ